MKEWDYITNVVDWYLAIDLIILSIYQNIYDSFIQIINLMVECLIVAFINHIFKRRWYNKDLIIFTNVRDWYFFFLFF